MEISVFELFRIGIGPSSSHTVGPMRAANNFVRLLSKERCLEQTARVSVSLYGSLAATGKGHGTDTALILGLLGEDPQSIDPDCIEALIAQVKESGTLKLGAEHAISFDARRDLDFKRYQPLPAHPNGMIFHAWSAQEQILLDQTVYSIGGGALASGEELAHPTEVTNSDLPYPFSSGAELLEHARNSSLSISEVMLENERTRHDEAYIFTQLATIWEAMQDCVKRGCAQSGTLPGGLRVNRRAQKLHQQLLEKQQNHSQAPTDSLAVMDWVNLYALAVNEENAAGGRVVTAPTNGAAGIIPAVLHYAVNFAQGAQVQGNSVQTPERFLLTAAAIGSLYKKNASISGADVGCQGEVGVACSMAAGALTEWLGGTPAQVCNAAEIGMEHNLGLTCDPIGGLVQIPCIERNAMGSMKAINAARIALCGDGTHHVSLDKVIQTMLVTGRDMNSQYKETSRGGLAVNVIEC